MFPTMPGNLSYKDEEGLVLVTEIYSARWLRWTHAGAMRLLHGVTPPVVLGANWLVLSGAATMHGDPCPGIYRPILLKVLENPANCTPEEIFKIAFRELAIEV